MVSTVFLPVCWKKRNKEQQMKRKGDNTLLKMCMFFFGLFKQTKESSDDTLYLISKIIISRMFSKWFSFHTVLP